MRRLQNRLKRGRSPARSGVSSCASACKPPKKPRRAKSRSGTARTASAKSSGEKRRAGRKRLRLARVEMPSWRTGMGRLPRGMIRIIYPAARVEFDMIPLTIEHGLYTTRRKPVGQKHSMETSVQLGIVRLSNVPVTKHQRIKREHSRYELHVQTQPRHRESWGRRGSSMVAGHCFTWPVLLCALVSCTCQIRAGCRTRLCSSLSRLRRRRYGCLCRGLGLSGNWLSDSRLGLGLSWSSSGGVHFRLRRLRSFRGLGRRLLGWGRGWSSYRRKRASVSATG